MRIWKKYLISLIVIIFLINGCGIDESNKSADTKAREASEKSLSEAWAQIGNPDIVNFQMLKNYNYIQEQCDRTDLICYAYYFNEIQGKLGDFIGKCVGYGVPYSAQVTNPEKVIEGDKELGYNWSGIHLMKLPQAEPHGLFVPATSSATWLMLINPETQEADRKSVV